MRLDAEPDITIELPPAAHPSDPVEPRRERPPHPSHGAFGRTIRVLAAVVSIMLLIGTGLVLLDQQQKSRAAIVERFRLRAEIAASFLESYVDELTSHEAEIAGARLATRSVSQRRFTDVTAALGFPAAVLLDGDGHLLRVLPNKPELVGTDLVSTYEHLRVAVAGRIGISNVVPSAARSIPVVGLAVPFESAAGPRVYSGALSISRTSLGTSYLRNFTPIRGATVWLLDANDQTIASNSDLRQSPDLFAREDPALGAALEESSSGSYDGPAGTARYVAVPVKGTPWRVVITSPESELFNSVGGLHLILPWIIFAGMILAAGAVVVLQVKLSRIRQDQLDHMGLLSLTDPMTGLYNRRGYEAAATQLLREAARQRHPAVLMMLDMDGLKIINDKLGHAVGDDAIVAAGTLLRSTFRDSDVIARLGGDEFCVLGMLPGGGDGSSQLTRLDAALDLFNAEDDAPFNLALSGGLALWDPHHPRRLSELEEEADRRMYIDKRDVRHRSSSVSTISVP